MALHGPRMASGKSLLESSRHRKQKHPQLSVAGTVAPPHPVAVTLKMASPQAGGQEGPGQEGLDWRWQGKVALQNSLSPPQCVRSSVGCFVCLFVCLFTALCGLCDLSSWTRGQTWTPSISFGSTGS